MHWSELLDGWVVSNYNLAAAVLKDHATFASDPRRAGLELPDEALNLQLLDPPDFSSLHRVIVSLLRHNDVDAALEYVGNLLADQLYVKPGLTVDLDGMSDVSLPIAETYMNQILGVTSFDHAEIAAIARDITNGMDSIFMPEYGPPARAARASMSKIIGGWIATSAPGSPLQRAAASANDAGVNRSTFTNSLRSIVLSAYTSLPAAISSVLYEVANRRIDCREWIERGLVDSGLK
ncbi:MAG: cytochrome monooxygenase [Subtercola sp.]|nr:cytochrome monooxygenase [Subtercola sp.]